MLAFSLTLALCSGALPPGEDFALPPVTLGMASPRLALPVVLAFDASMTDDVTPLIKNDGTTRAGGSRDPVWAIARFGLNVARRHFEDAKWVDTHDRQLVVKRVAVTFRSGPAYDVEVEVDRVEGGRRVGAASGRGFGTGQRNTAQRAGAAYAQAFGAKPKNGLTEADPVADANVIRNATLQALDAAMLQAAMAWSGEQQMAKAKADAEALMKQAQQPAPQKAPAKK